MSKPTHYSTFVVVSGPPLPDLPSELLELAMKDLATVERRPLYRVDMRTFHSPERGLCSVCMAGAVMTRFLHHKDLCTSPVGMFDEVTAMKLMALDMMRVGNVRAAVRTMGLSAKSSLVNRNVVSYENSPEFFRNDMAEMISDLKCALL